MVTPKRRPENMFEILDLVASCHSIQDRVKILRQYDDVMFRKFFKIAYDNDNSYSELFENKWVPRHISHQQQWENVLRRFEPIFKNDHPASLQRKRDIFNVQIGGIHKNDMVIFIKCFSGKFKWKRINRNVINQAYPGLLTDKTK